MRGRRRKRQQNKAKTHLSDTGEERRQDTGKIKDERETTANKLKEPQKEHGKEAKARKRVRRTEAKRTMQRETDAEGGKEAYVQP